MPNRIPFGQRPRPNTCRLRHQGLGQISSSLSVLPKVINIFYISGFDDQIRARHVRSKMDLFWREEDIFTIVEGVRSGRESLVVK